MELHWICPPKGYNERGVWYICAALSAIFPINELKLPIRLEFRLQIDREMCEMIDFCDMGGSASSLSIMRRPGP